MIVCGIDPGVADLGAVALEDGRLTWTHHHHTKAQGEEVADVLPRARAQVGALDRAFADFFYPRGLGMEDIIWAVEGWEDFGGGHKREARRRHYTPIMIALLSAWIEVPVHWQKPSKVKREMNTYLHMWRQKRSVVPGDEALTNEHLRDAAAHAVYREGRARIDERLG